MVAMGMETCPWLPLDPMLSSIVVRSTDMRTLLTRWCLALVFTAGMAATMAARADVHVSLGGPEDACAGGFISVDTKGHLRNVSLYGERFAQGDAEATLRW